METKKLNMILIAREISTCCVCKDFIQCWYIGPMPLDLMNIRNNIETGKYTWTTETLKLKEKYEDMLINYKVEFIICYDNGDIYTNLGVLDDGSLYYDH